MCTNADQRILSVVLQVSSLPPWVECSIFAESAASACSRAFNSFFRDGSPFCLTLSYHCSQEANIALLQVLVSPIVSCIKS